MVLLGGDCLKFYLNTLQFTIHEAVLIEVSNNLVYNHEY